MTLRAWLARGLAIFAIYLVAGCSVPPLETGEKNPDARVWNGRLSLNVDSGTAQPFSAAFELKGNAGEGELTLFSPLGSILATLRWAPGLAVLRTARDTQRFDSLEMLTTQLTGTPLPIHGMFDWLDGVNTTSAGWRADLSGLEQGRLIATRTDPAAPTAVLRLILDRQDQPGKPETIMSR